MLDKDTLFYIYDGFYFDYINSPHIKSGNEGKLYKDTDIVMYEDLLRNGFTKGEAESLIYSKNPDFDMTCHFVAYIIALLYNDTCFSEDDIKELIYNLTDKEIEDEKFIYRVFIYKRDLF